MAESEDEEAHECYTFEEKQVASLEEDLQEAYDAIEVFLQAKLDVEYGMTGADRRVQEALDRLEDLVAK